MATLKKLKPGQDLWSLETTKMGNTTMRRKALYRVRVVEVDPSPEPKWAMCSWNGNTPRKYDARDVARLRVKEPQEKGRDFFGHPKY